MDPKPNVSCILVGCGYLGAKIFQRLSRSSYKVVGIVRSKETHESLLSRGYQIECCDVSRSDAAKQLQALCHSTLCQAAPTLWIHCASTRGGDEAQYRGVYLLGVRSLISAFPDAYGIFVSSTSVYPQRDGQWVQEDSQTDNCLTRAQILLEAEKLVLQNGGAVARLAGIYGPGRSVLLRKFLRGEAVIEADGGRWINQIHVEDAADAIGLIAAVQPRGEIFNVADDSPMTQREVYTEMAKRLSRDLPPRADAPIVRKRGNTSKRVSNQKLKTLGWKPKYPNFFEAWEELLSAEKG